jgi:hypothetical protein
METNPVGPVEEQDLFQLGDVIDGDYTGKLAIVPQNDSHSQFQ